MFYTFEQEKYEEHLEIERFVIVEADNDTDARTRASYFGINLDEEDSDGSSRRWWEDRDGGWRRDAPGIMGYRISQYTDRGGWIILYKNDNLVSSRAIPCDDEYDPFEAALELSRYPDSFSIAI